MSNSDEREPAAGQPHAKEPDPRDVEEASDARPLVGSQLFRDSGALNAPDIRRLLTDVAVRMGGAPQADVLRRSLRTMLALYDAEAQGGQPVVRFGRTEQRIILPGAP